MTTLGVFVLQIIAMVHDVMTRNLQSLFLLPANLPLCNGLFVKMQIQLSVKE